MLEPLLSTFLALLGCALDAFSLFWLALSRSTGFFSGTSCFSHRVADAFRGRCDLSAFDRFALHAPRRTPPSENQKHPAPGVSHPSRSPRYRRRYVLLFPRSVSTGKLALSDPDIAPQHSRASIRRWAADVLQGVGYRPYADLTEASLSAKPADGNWSDEGVANVDGARLNQINLRFARAYRAYLANAKLWRANLEGAYLSEADLRGANMREAVLRDAILDRARISRALLVSSDIRNANLIGADLRAADLSYCNLENSRLSIAVLNSASRLHAVNLAQSAQLSRSDLTGADLRDTKLEQSVLSYANLQQADLSSAKMAYAKLGGAQLKGAILLDADLTSADLQGAYLSGAVLRDADLHNTVLSGADLRGASGLTSTQLCTAKWRGALLDPDMETALQTQCPQ